MSDVVRRLFGPLTGANALPAGYQRPLYAVLAFAFVLRFALACASPSIHQADEIYQVSEQANRAVHGFGIVSWEFAAAARSALYPSLVVPIFRLDVSPGVRQILIAALFTCLSLIPVAVAFHWAGRLYGIRGAVIASVMIATWFELVYFAPKPTADAVSSYFFVAALFLGRPGASSTSIMLASMSLVLTLALRMQIAPAVGLAFLLLVFADVRRRLVPVLGGLALALAIVGGIEWMWWGTPFLGHVNYLRLEFGNSVSAQFGREPLTFFVKNYVLIYGAALPVVILLALAGARQAPVLLLAAVALIVPFHFVAHKEYRFLVVALPVVVLLMGLATADLAARIPTLSTNRSLAIAAAAWLMAMTAVSLGDSYRPYWTRQRNHIWAFREISRRPDACGVALVAIRWFHTPGYSGLGRDIPIYETGRDPLSPQLAAAANYVLVGHKASQPGPPYVRLITYKRPEEHLFYRPGPCVPDPSAKVTVPDRVPGGG